MPAAPPHDPAGPQRPPSGNPALQALFDDPDAELTDEALLDLYQTLSEDELLNQLRDVAQAARDAAAAYARKAERLESLAHRLEAQGQLEADRIAARRGSGSVPEAAAHGGSDTVPMPNPGPGGAGKVSERRW